MKCPVCKRLIFNSEPSCQHCGFTDLHREFINRQDAQDWEFCVVVPYREKWEKGVLDADAWLKRIYECAIFHDEIEKKRATGLTLNTDTDLNVENPESFRSLSIREYAGDIDDVLASRLAKFCNIEEIFFSFMYQGWICVESLNAIIRTFPNLTKLTLLVAINCEMLTKIDLAKIEELHITLQDSFSPTSLTAPVLKSLSITGCFMGIKKSEAKKIKRSQYDLTGMPELENLEIKYCSDFDYHSLSSLTKLRHLRVYDESSIPINLVWLSSKYHLETLSVYGKVQSMDGIDCQTDLQRLNLRHNNISDISKLEYLTKLKCLDLGFNEIANIDVLENLHHLECVDLTNNNLVDETYLRSLKIPTTIFTKLDKELHSIKEMFAGKVIGTFPGDVCYLTKKWETKDLNAESPYTRKTILKWREKEYQERVKEVVQTIFERKYHELCKDYYPGSVKKVEKQHKEVYINTALQHYPFLQLTRDMQIDMSSS